MKHQKTKRQSISPHTFNMLIFALVLVVAILITVLIHTLSRALQKKEEEKQQVAVNGDGHTPSVTYHLENPYAGVLSFCSPTTPWTEAQVDAVFSSLVPLKSFSVHGEEPYLLKQDNLHAKAEAVMALRDLCLALRKTGMTATPLVTEAYTSYAEAKEEAGKTYLHSGYAITLALQITLEGAEETLPLTDSHPLVASVALWLSTHAHEYGFILPDAENAGRLLYVSPPHATAMKDQGLAPATYLSLLHTYPQSSPLVVTETGRWHIFYLPATHGTAMLALPQNTAYAVTGDGVDGFVITLLV